MCAPKSNIILIGYRATGKSLIGERLARRLGFAFIDMDKEIEARQHTSIQRMVTEHGWEYFRNQERSLLQELTDRVNLVVATGGGAVLQQDIWPRIMANGLCVWLTADRNTICKRLAADPATESQRPSLTGEDIHAEVDRVLAAREPLYRQGSHIIVDTARQTPDEAAQIIGAAYESCNRRET